MVFVCLLIVCTCILLWLCLREREGGKKVSQNVCQPFLLRLGEVQSIKGNLCEVDQKEEDLGN